MTTTHLTSPSGCKPFHSRFRRVLAWVLIAAQCGPASLWAQVSVSPGSAQSQTPQITSTASGTPMVMIAAPNGSGLSNNQFQEFNVGPQGLIFNNATQDVRTQLAGYVQANPALLSGPARVVLAQVNGGLPSSLLGYLEIAGGRADLVIANPAGMVCNGCGFINAARAVITTGRPGFGADGSLTWFTVSGGSIQVGTQGLDGRQLDRVDLISRSVQVNGKLWAQNALQVVTGLNDVSYDGQQVRARPSESSALPASPLAIDVALLGGMYAGRIRLIGTEAGVGVNSQGSLLASSGDIEIDQAGRVAQSGSTGASGSVRLRGSALQLADSNLSAGADLQLAARGGPPDADHLDQGSIDLSRAQVTVAGTATAQADGDFIHDGAQSTAARWQIEARTFSNRDGVLSQSGVGSEPDGQTLQVTARQIDSEGRIESNGDVKLQADTFHNQGSVRAVGNLIVQSGAIHNAGTLAAGQQLSMQGDTLDNTGVIIGASVSAQATQRITNTGALAVIAATDRNGLLELLAPEVHNRDDITPTDTTPAPTIVGLGEVVIAGGRNADGTYTRAREVLNQSASIESGADLSIHADTLTNRRSVLSVSTAYDRDVPQDVLDTLGITLSGRVGWFNMPFSQAALQPGGAYIAPPHGGSMNSDYYNTTYWGTARSQGLDAISPQARILVGGDFNANVGVLNNDTSQIAAAGDVRLADDATVNQRSVAQQVKVTYSGTYNYQTYKQEQWIYTFCDGGCNKPADIRYYTQAVFNASLAGNSTLSGSGLTLNNQTVAQQPSRGSAVVAQPSATDWLSRLAVPGSGGMYRVVPGPDSSYLVNTNPAFTDRNNFLSSDYYFQMMGVNPAQIQKRLGDAYYEQQLVQGQILELTGRKVLTGYADTQAEYKALMTAGAELAQDLRLAPGVGLSAEQVRQLTRNVVILQEQVVDGQKVLVPVVYLAAASQRNLGAGAIVAAAQVDLGNATVVSNSGQIAADQNLSLSAQRLDNQGGRLDSGQQMSLRTTGDMNLQGAQIKAGELVLEAGGNVDLSAQSHTQTQIGRGGTRSTTSVGPQASIEVDRDAQIAIGGNLTQNAGALSVGGNLDARVGGSWNLGTATANETQNINAPGTHAEANSNNLVGSTLRIGGKTRIDVGQDFTAQGADIALNGGSVQAQGSITLQAAQTTSTSHSTHQGSESNGLNKSSHFDERNTSDQSTLTTRLQSGCNLSLRAGQDVQVMGSTVTLTSDAQGEGALDVQAGRNVIVGAVSEQHHFDQTNAGDVSNRHSSSTETDSVRRDTSLSVGSAVSANTVRIRSGQDTTVKGSAVVGSGDVSVTAGRDLDISAATEQSRLEQGSYSRKDGLMSNGGLSVTDGTRVVEHTNVQTRSVSQASTVGSVAGNVSLQAGRAYTQVGSDVAAPVGDIQISARSVNIREARDTASEIQNSEVRQSGVTLAVTNPVLDAGRKIEALADAGGKTSSGRMKALAAGSAALTAKGAVDAVQGDPGSSDGGSVGAAGGVGISLSVGTSSSQGKSEAQIDAARGSTVVAGRNISIEAKGAGQQSDLTIQGTDINAAGTTSLAAEHDVKLQAAQNTSSVHSESSSSSASVGVGFNVGAKRSGFSVNLALALAQGNTDGEDVTYTNTHVTGQKVVVQSGHDTTLRGATVQGEQVTADVGGNLSIESLQDRGHYTSDSSSVGVGVSVPIGVGTGSVSVDASQSRIRSDYASVAEQSGIRAGDEGFNVKVGGDTTLVGGAITSTQSAVTGQKNSFSTGGQLSTRDINNHADYEADSMSVVLSTSGPSDTGNGLSPSLSGAGKGEDSGHASSTTTAGISGIAGDRSKRTGDKEQGIDRIFDAQKVSQEIQAQTVITREAGTQASRVIENYATTERQKLQTQLKQTSSEAEKVALQARIKEINIEERVMNLLVGAVTGFGDVAALKEGLGAAAEEMRDITIANSKLSKGITDGTTTLTNLMEGKSEGVRGDGIGTGGTRLNLDNICGVGNERCETNPDGTLAYDSEGRVQWKGLKTSDVTLQKYLDSEEGQGAAGLTGGIQGWKGTLFGRPYEAGSWQDKLIEAFGGTHDVVGGQLPGGYDADGNTKRGMGGVERFVRDRGSELALLPAAPFALSEMLPPEAWKAIAILIQANR